MTIDDANPKVHFLMRGISGKKVEARMIPKRRGRGNEHLNVGDPGHVGAERPRRD